jgi:hypothetical protein
MVIIKSTLQLKTGQELVNGFCRPVKFYVDDENKRIAIQLMVWIDQNAYINNKSPVQVEDMVNSEGDKVLFNQFQFPFNQVTEILTANAKLADTAKEILKKWLTDNNISFDEV